MVLVSVVVPCHNAESFIEATVRSALAQEGVEIEVIVVDDGSSDNSARIVQSAFGRDARVHLLRQSQSGVAVARNRGLFAVQPASRYVHFLDADDLLVPGALARLAETLEADPSLVATFGTCSRIDGCGTLIVDAPDYSRVYFVDSDGSVVEHQSGGRIGYWHILPIQPILTPGQCLVRRSALSAAGVFDQACAPCEDWDLWLRLARHGELQSEAFEVAQYRDHPDMASRQFKLMRRKRRTVYLKHLALAAPDEHQRFRAAFRFGMYQLEARWSQGWAHDEIASYRPLPAARFALRSLRYRVRNLAALAGRRPALRT